MSTKKKGLRTTSGEWAKHLRKFKKRKFWKAERKEAKKSKHVAPEEDHQKNGWKNLNRQQNAGIDFIANKFDPTEWKW